MQTLDQETALCNALEQSGREYARAIGELDVLMSVLAGGTGDEQTALQLQRLAVRTRDTEARVTPLRKQWKAHGKMPGYRLREVMASQERLLGELIQRIDDIERVAREARDQLIPRIDKTTQTREMRSAYARSIRHATE